MRLIYSLGILLYGSILRLIAPFHTKARLWTEGRKDWYLRMSQTVETGQKHIWFHFASLGEFEQGRAVLEEIKKKYSDKKIIITFYSPSGYEIRKNTNLADYVFYLPADTAGNAKRFTDLIQPEFVVFTKYEYWYYYFQELAQRQIPLLMISAIFRPEQIFFQPYGGFFRKILECVSYFFVQNEESLHLLKENGFRNVGITGDTRFDRVIQLPLQKKEIPEVAQFVADHPVLIAGSTWPDDEVLLHDLAGQYGEWKMIIAPHEIHDKHIQSIQELFPAALRFSGFSVYSPEVIRSAQVLIIDNIGMLSSLYGYGNVAYIGGGFGAGIHNTLEAATYGIPVIFGPKYHKFQEAKDLIECGAGFSISGTAELQTVFAEFQQLEKRVFAGEEARKYVRQRAGATAVIMKYLICKKLL
ncbi:3-deoxy-D-manno-octulosonic-acid transferase [Sphingobacterium spiritivorum ATCC 33300]|uniref:3-deoxy-D-manno-octulosonic acid transferase n=1 Tax=Sphingobacterium spiritivorum ATCC 33300 TaxID=525372 RepID=C2G0P5_SPHSI|nr:glycosyltransferase N-terminal domain-containing protein [Sphingobacterium spiritivorum]EEI91425.1 3-deoxy-D-manno-octulosonic-acid transferase [Sphingobacterium spiritivorum ATCC 33300]QQS97519.1 3-deoxy-D-manno-octulosonic acid transferase [Sphingobacterium spiritivorum]